MGRGLYETCMLPTDVKVSGVSLIPPSDRADRALEKDRDARKEQREDGAASQAREDAYTYATTARSDLSKKSVATILSQLSLLKLSPSERAALTILLTTLTPDRKSEAGAASSPEGSIGSEDIATKLLSDPTPGLPPTDHVAGVAETPGAAIDQHAHKSGDAKVLHGDKQVLYHQDSPSSLVRALAKALPTPKQQHEFASALASKNPSLLKPLLQRLTPQTRLQALKEIASLIKALRASLLQPEGVRNRGVVQKALDQARVLVEGLKEGLDPSAVPPEIAASLPQGKASKTAAAGRSEESENSFSTLASSGECRFFGGDATNQAEGANRAMAAGFCVIMAGGRVVSTPPGTPPGQTLAELRGGPDPSKPVKGGTGGPGRNGDGGEDLGRLAAVYSRGERQFA